MSMAFRGNMGAADRIVRAVMAASLVLFGAVGLVPGAWRLVLPVAGVLIGLTAAAGYCPLYRLLQLDRPGR